MKKYILVFSWLLINLLVFKQITFAEESGVDELLNLLADKKVITIEDVAGLRADLAIKKQEEKEKQKDFNVRAAKSIKISGYTQVRYLQDKTSVETFDIRRVRLDIKGDITERFDYRTQLELGGSFKYKSFVNAPIKNGKYDSTDLAVSGGLLLLDAILGYKVNSSLKISLGQFFIPFSLENLTSNTKLETINRTQVVEALTARSKDVIGNQNGRDTGIQASGSILEANNLNLLDYAFGLFNGAGTNKADLNDRKDFVGRLVFHLVKDLSIGGSYYSGSYSLSNASKNKDTRTRLGAEIAYVKDDVSLKGEYIHGKDAAINKEGWYLQAGYYFVSKQFQGVLKYDSYDSDTKVKKNENSVSTIGANWYFNSFSFLQINYEIKDEKGKDIKNNALTGQLTLQF